MNRRAAAAIGLSACIVATVGCADRREIPAQPDPVVPAVHPPTPTRAGKVTSIELQDLFLLQQEDRILLYDVRPGFYHAMGHIPGSIHWPKAAFDTQRQAREREIRTARKAGKVVVLYCTDAACPDARAVAGRLSDLGHDVSVLDGGWQLWKSTGMPTGSEFAE